MLQISLQQAIEISFFFLRFQERARTLCTVAISLNVFFWCLMPISTLEKFLICLLFLNELLIPMLKLKPCTFLARYSPCFFTVWIHSSKTRVNFIWTGAHSSTRQIVQLSCHWIIVWWVFYMIMMCKSAFSPEFFSQHLFRKNIVLTDFKMFRLIFRLWNKLYCIVST